jgi:putative peptide zinc metalloprotease protein
MKMSAGLPRLRPEFEISSWDRPLRSQQRHFARDQESGAVVELGAEAAFLVRHLDGRIGTSDLSRLYREEFGKDVSEADLDILLESLAEAGLLEGIDAHERERTFPEFLADNDFFPMARLPLGKGDRFFGRLAGWLGWTFTWPFHLLTVGAFLWAVKIMYLSWSEFFVHLIARFSLSFLVVLVLVSALVVRSSRSVIHAVQCKRYGRRVTEFGFAFAFYLVPSLYTNWADAMYIREGRKRAWVAFAGIYVQALLWAGATIAWSLTVPGSVWNVAWLTLSFAAAFNLVFFTANPLAEADGYLLLMNWLETPRLRERALASFGSWITLRVPAEISSPRDRRRFTAYGLFCFVYGVFFLGWIGWHLWIRLTEALEGVGALLALAFAVFVVQKPLIDSMARKRWVRWLFSHDGGSLRWSVRLAIVAGIVLIGFIPYPYETGGPFTLLPIAQSEIHTQMEGQIVEVRVVEGDLVSEGQLLAVVDQREIRRNYAASLEQLAASEAKLNLAIAGSKIENVVAAERRLQKAEQEVELARVRYRSSTARAERLEQAYADHLVTARDYNNAQDMRDSDYQTLQVALSARSVAEAELDMVKSGARPEEIEALEAEMRSLETLLDDLKQQLTLTELRAPVAGRVVTPYVDQKVGQYLQTGQLFAKIEESRTIRAEVAVPEDAAPEVVKGARVRVSPWAYPNEIFIGTVVSVAPAATEDMQSTFVRVVTEIPNPDGRLMSNMTGYAKIATSEKPLWEVFLWPLIRWIKVQVWYWIP